MEVDQESPQPFAFRNFDIEGIQNYIVPLATAFAAIVNR